MAFLHTHPLSAAGPSSLHMPRYVGQAPGSAASYLTWVSEAWCEFHFAPALHLQAALTSDGLDPDSRVPSCPPWMMWFPL